MTHEEIGSLYRLAKKAGFTIRQESSCLIMAKYTPRRKSLSRGAIIFDNGTAIDMRVELESARLMRKLSEVKTILGL